MSAAFFALPRDVLALARELRLPGEVCDRLSRAALPALLEPHAAACAALADPARACAAWKQLEGEFSGRDPGGMRVLALYLAAACRTREIDRQRGIPDAVFLDTMGCFLRFLEEAYACTGSFSFDRGPWAWRQLAGLLFRLGTLEFEYRPLTGQEPVPPGLAPGCPVLSVHIPSDARLTDEALRASYLQAERFFAGPGAALCTGGAPRAMICGSWLLSPALRALLPVSSGIVRFGGDYALYAVNPDDESFYRWLFRGLHPPAPLPLQTSLQRAVAAHLQKGGKIGAATGFKQTR